MSTTAVFCGISRSHLRWRRPVSPGIWTLIGALAIPLWATWPALSLRTREMPAFECLTLIFLVASLVLGVIERPVARVDAQISTWRPWIPALAFAVGESGSAVCFLLATHYIPAAEANLIAYLWPGMIAGIGAVLGLFRLRIRHVTGIALGFAGAAILMAGGTLSVSFTGMGLALLSGVAWAIYCIFRLTWREPCGNLLARGFALSTILCGIMHLLLEPSVMPTLGGAAAAGVVGIVPAACANLAWDEGFRRGDSQLLAVMAYATPLVSALLLTVLGLESFTWRLLIGAVVIGLAGVLSRADP